MGQIYLRTKTDGTKVNKQCPVVLMPVHFPADDNTMTACGARKAVLVAIITIQPSAYYMPGSVGFLACAYHARCDHSTACSPEQQRPLPRHTWMQIQANDLAHSEHVPATEACQSSEWSPILAIEEVLNIPNIH